MSQKSTVEESNKKTEESKENPKNKQSEIFFLSQKLPTLGH